MRCCLAGIFGNRLRYSWRRLDTLIETFLPKAIREVDPLCGALVEKIEQRRAALLGLDAPATSAAVVQVLHEPAEASQTSTDKIRAALDHIRGKAALPAPGDGDRGGPTAY
jgi:hypothetical protein